MLPGVGFFYSGLTGKKSALSMIMLSFIAMSVGAVQVLLLCLSLLIISGLYGGTPSRSPKRQTGSSVILTTSDLKAC
jgi:ammonia channel protein AmtB